MLTNTRLALTLLVASAPAAIAQQPAQTAAPQQPAPVAPASAPPAASAQAAAPSQPMTPAEKRRADLDADIKRLNQLTQELKAEVDKTDKYTLSVKVIRKAQEIESLARSIKERSKQM